MKRILSIMDIKHIKKQLGLFVFLSFTVSCHCLDEYEREYFLGPRHYNPHPYEIEFEISRLSDTGPHTFPDTEDDDDDYNSGNRYNIISLGNQKPKYSEDNESPYTKVSKKVKNYIYGGYEDDDHEDEYDNEIYYDALADHGAKVLSHPAHELSKYSGPSNKKNYAFAYKVKDKKTGDDFSHQQVRNAKATNGEYRVKLPDGRIQIVSYKADKNGYNADVKYEHDPEIIHKKIVNSFISDPEHYEVEKVPVKEYSPPSSDYGYEHDDYGYEDDEEKEQHVQNSHPDVEIYSANPRDQVRQNVKYVSTTVRPLAYQKNVVRYTSTPVPPRTHSYKTGVNNNGIYNIDVNKYKKNVASTTPYPVGDEYHKALAQEDELPEGIYIVGKSGHK